MKTKSIGWSYPTSPNAGKFKFSRGCWVVKIQEDDQIPVAINGFKDKAEAEDYAAKLSFPWQDPSRLVAVPLPSVMPPKTALPCGCEHVGILSACPIHQPSSQPCKTLAEHNATPNGRF